MATRIKRHARVRAKIVGTKARPRVSVYRSSRFIFAQAIDDQKSFTLASSSDKKIKKEKATKLNRAKSIGLDLAAKLKQAKINEVVFDRGGYRYHGRVQAVAEGLREGGIKL